MLDHLTKGRIYAGFARGYQDRWVNVLGQQYHVTGAPMDGSSIDNHNRKVYEETLKVIKKAWTEETFNYDGEYYKIPYPYEEGITPLAGAPSGPARIGAPGEVDDQGVIRKSASCPKPYQQPHPPLFQPFSVSEMTIRYTAAQDIVPWILVSNPPDFRQLCETYRDVAAENGRNPRRWAKASAPSAPSISATPKQEAVELLRETNYAGFHDYFGSFGFWEAFRIPGRRAKVPARPVTRRCRRRSGPSSACARSRYALAGTPDQILRDFETSPPSTASGELEWFGWFFDQGFMSLDDERRQMESFAKHIIPAFR